MPTALDSARRINPLRPHSSLLATDVRLHAYVLMDNHVHLLATPPAVGDVGRMMQRLGRQYVGQFNSRHGRTGTLWEGRYKAGLVDSERYVLACYRYIEFNPVRARMTEDPVAWRWSSCAANLGLRPQSGLTPHPAWLALGATPADRAAAYRRLLDEALPGDTLADIRQSLQQQRALGRDDFRIMVEAKSRRFAGTRPAHRPPKPSSPDK